MYGDPNVASLASNARVALYGDLSSYSFHMADQGTDAMEREKAFLFASQEGRFLWHIDEALRRLYKKPENSHRKFCKSCGAAAEYRVPTDDNRPRAALEAATARAEIEQEIKLLRRQRDDGSFFNVAGTVGPDSPAGLFIGFIVLVIFVCAVGFQLNKRQVNIAVVSIGIDFFQVLAIFSQSRVKWPPVVKELLHVLSAFNLNIEIVAPECLIPDVSYKQKFWFIMLLPLCVGGGVAAYLGSTSAGSIGTALSFGVGA